MNRPTVTYRLIRYKCGHTLRSHDDCQATAADLRSRSVERSEADCSWCRRLAELRKQDRK